MTRADAHDGAPAIGPVLFLGGRDGDRLLLSALAARPADGPTPSLRTDDGDADCQTLAIHRGVRLLAYRFSLPFGADGRYRFDGTEFPVNTDFGGDLRLAYVSCNGQEHGDRERNPAERNALWRRLARDHEAAPFQLLLHGGDQLYADELLQAHPAVARWASSHRRQDSDEDDAPEIAEALREDLFNRYLALYADPDVAWLMARVPSLSMWDDHDICDGWGSLPDWKLDAAVGRSVLATAREAFLLFQHGTDGDRLPPMFTDPAGHTLTWSLGLPGLQLTAPDLRSERRRERVLGPAGWHALEAALEEPAEGALFVLSSVPALGPRLSWVERVMMLLPHMQKYEDDLRDQWQSRAHRAEWQRFLRTLLRVHDTARPVTLLSGEIHLATRGTMAAAAGPIHQLVASGIAHPPPPELYARTLGALASLGEAPLVDHPISLHPLPGQRRIYTAQRNYLVLSRRAGRWRATWTLEADGRTPALDLGEAVSTGAPTGEVDPA